MYVYIYILALKWCTGHRIGSLNMKCVVFFPEFEASSFQPWHSAMLALGRK